MGLDTLPPEQPGTPEPPPPSEPRPPLGQPPAAQPPRRVNVWAILLGSLVDLVSTEIVAGVVGVLVPDPRIFVVLGLGLAMTALGGYVAAAVAGRRSLAHGLGVGILSTIAGFILSRARGGGAQVELPAWYDPVGYGLTIPAGVLGAWAHRRVWGERQAVTTERTQAYPNVRQAVWLVVLALLVTGVATIAAGIVISLTFTGVAPIAGWGVPVIIIGAALGYALVIGFAIRKARAPVSEVLPIRRIRAAWLWPVIPTILGTAILLSEIANLFRRAFSVPRVPLDPAEIFGSLETMFWAAAIFIVLVAPVAEELLFRGVILRGFLRQYTMRRAIVASAVLFAVFHVNPLQFPTALILGLLFAWWRARTGSLILPMLGHTLNNGLALAAPRLPWAGALGLATVASARAFQPLWLDAIGVALLAAGIVYFRAATRISTMAGA